MDICRDNVHRWICRRLQDLCEKGVNMKFKVLEGRFRRWGPASNPYSFKKKSFEEWLGNYFVAKDAGWKTWEDVLKNGDPGDFASLRQYVSLSPAQFEDLRTAENKHREKESKKYDAWLKKASDKELHDTMFQMEMGNFIPWPEYRRIQAELDKREKGK